MNVAEIRAKYPEYSDLSDKELLDGLHKQFYSDIPLQQFYEKTGYVTAKPQPIGKDAFANTLRDEVRGASTLDRTAAGFGTALSNAVEGVKQFAGAEDQDRIAANKVIESEAPAASVAGNLALAAMPIGGATNSMRAAVGMGGLFGASQPVANANSIADVAKGKAFNTFGGMALSGAGQKAANMASSALAKRSADLAAKKVANRTVDETLQESLAAGYRVPMSQMPDSGFFVRSAEGLSGKYKTNQLAGIKNQAVTDNLARKALGLGDDVQLTPETMQAVRKEAFNVGYAPIESIGSIKTDGAFNSALTKIAANRKMAARSFPNAAKDEVTPFIEGLKVAEFDAADGIKMIQALRDDAGAKFAQGDKAVGRAMREAAKALEDQIERALAAKGSDGAALLAGFRAARAQMAKSHTVEKAIRDGGGTVDAKVLARELQKGKPLSGELKTAAKFANNFGDVAGIPKSGNANPFTAVDFMQAGISSPLGFMAGGAPGMAAALGLPLARLGARQAILSGPVQRAVANPEYALSPAARSLGGLLQYSPVGATAIGVPALNQ